MESTYFIASIFIGSNMLLGIFVIVATIVLYLGFTVDGFTYPSSIHLNQRKQSHRIFKSFVLSSQLNPDWIEKTVTQDTAVQRIDCYLSTLLPQYSRSFLFPFSLLLLIV